MRLLLFKNHTEIETKRLIPDLFFLFKNPLYEVKGFSHHRLFQKISVGLDDDIH